MINVFVVLLQIYFPIFYTPPTVQTNVVDNVVTLSVPVTVEGNPFTDMEVLAYYEDGFIRRGYYDGNNTFLVKRHFEESVEMGFTVKVFKNGIEVQSFTGSFEVNHQYAPGLFNCGKLHNNGTAYLNAGRCGAWGEFGAGVPEDMLNSANFPNTVSPRYDDAYSFIDEANHLFLNSFYVVGMGVGGDSHVSPYVNADLNGSPLNDNLTFDIDKLREWEAWMYEANRNGITIHFLLGEGEAENKLELDNATLGIERITWYKEAVARFGYLPGIYFDVTEEYDLHLNIGHEEALEWACYLRDVDSTVTPVTVHNFRQNWAAVYFPFLASPCIDLTSLQAFEDVEQLPILFHNVRILPVHVTEPIYLPFQDHCQRFRRFMINGGAGMAFYQDSLNINAKSLYLFTTEVCRVQ